MDIIFMNLENSKTSEPLVLVLKLTNKSDLRTGEKIIALFWKSTEKVPINHQYKYM